MKSPDYVAGLQDACEVLDNAMAHISAQVAALSIKSDRHRAEAFGYLQIMQSFADKAKEQIRNRMKP